MAESTKVRLVWCPKCENLLPEQADYPVYQCGGCGAVLRAENKNQSGDGFSEKSGEGVVGGVVAEGRDSQDMGMVDLDVEAKSNSGSLKSEDKKQQADKDDDNSYADTSRNQSKAKFGKLVVEDGLDVDVDSNDLGNLAGKECRDSVALNGCTSESLRSGRISSLQRQEGGDMEGFRRIMKSEVEGVGISTSNYQDEGPSAHNWNSSYGYREGFINKDHHSGDGRVEYLDKDRAELLRKLEELKEQLSRCGYGSDNPKENPPFNRMVARPDHQNGPDPWYPGVSSASNGTAVQFLSPVNHSTAIPHFSHHPEPFPYSHNHQMSLHGFHPSLPKPNHIPGYGDPFGPQVLGRGQHQAPGQYQQPHHQYFSAHYFDTNPDPFEPYASNGTFHHPTCLCFHCYNKHHGQVAPIPPSNLSNKRFPDFSNSPIMYPQEIPGALGPSVHQPRSSIPPLLSNLGPQSHLRRPSDFNSQMGGFVRGPPQNVILASIGRRCHPIAGGAPFLTCCNCFELLRIPRKVLLSAKKKKPQNVRCGSCSTVIKFSVVNKKLILSVNTEAEQPSDEKDNCSGLKMVDNSSYSYGNVRRTNVTFSSDDYDNSGYDFLVVDADPIESSMGQGQNATKSQEMQTFGSSSSSLYEEENGLVDALNGLREGTISVQKPAVPSPPLPGSPLQQYFDYSNTNHQFGKGNRSSRFDQEKAITNKATARQNSMKEESLATEMDVSFCESSSNGVSQETEVPSKVDNTTKNIKGVESFFANLIKKSFKDVTKSNQTDKRGRNDVSVNGHVIPERLVKKAVKLAGPIHPGQYWYDSHAGFWGVMGGPCLGIIPPVIEEFKHPMPENCSGGTTGVFVNGRELHQKDLDLLASRGLPTERDRSYIIEMSGRVVDEDTGEELESLGKLAPTVQRAKHGFGMKVPRMAM